MNFLKLVMSFVVSIFKKQSTNAETESEVELKLITIIKEFISDKDFSKFEIAMMKQLGSPANWTTFISKERINYVISAASSGKLNSVDDFIKEYSDKLPQTAIVILNSFR